MRLADAAMALWVLYCTVGAGAARAQDGGGETAAGDGSALPVSARARLDLRLSASRASEPWAWDAQSRSPLDGSRFMTDVTAGGDATGTLYLKGAASWMDANDAAGRVAFALQQGDYLYRRASGRGSLSVLVFGDERRYFTGELGNPLMEDDVVAGFEHRYGGAVGATHGAAGADYLVSSLENGSDADLLQRGALRVSSRALHAAVAYQHLRPQSGEDEAVVQAEAAGCYRRFTAILSYAQSGFGDGFFVPSGSFGSGDYADAAPENSATAAEARLCAVTLRDIRIDAIYRYQMTGARYVNELASNRPGTVNQTAELHAAHRRYAIDGRLVWRDEDHVAIEPSQRRALEGTLRAFLRDNSQVLLRAAAERREYQGREESDAGLVQGGYRRELQRFMGGVHLMLDDIGNDATPRAAVEARVNWSATSAFYARWMVDGEVRRADAVYARLEFRPTGRTWVTLAYGWAQSGDTPYLFDDRDGLPLRDARDVLTFTVRGDF